MVFRLLSGVMAALFALGAAVQYNDPDPWRWIAIYAAAAVVSGVAGAEGRLSAAWPAVVGGIAAVWGVTVVVGVEGFAVYGSMFDAWEMAAVPVEEAREATGLVVIACWMAALVGRALGWGKRGR